MTAPQEDADVETASAAYAARFASPIGQWMLRTQLDVTLDLLKGLQTASILDVGGGHGQLAPALAGRGHAVSVVVSSPQAVAACLRPSLDSGRVDLIAGALRNPPVAPKSFDVVLSYRLLAHAHDLRDLIAGLCRPARVAVIVDYATSRSFNAISEPLFAVKKRVEQNTRPFRVSRDADIASLFQQSGFHLKERRAQFFWPMALHRALNAPGFSRLLEGAAAGLGLRSRFGSPVIARFDRD